MTDMRSSDRVNSFDEPMNECGHVIKSSRIDPLLGIHVVGKKCLQHF